MQLSNTPQEAYRRVDFDARVSGADSRQLVSLCLEHAVSALGTADYAHGAGNALLRNRSLARALSAVVALQMGVNGEGGVVDALRQFYEAARQTILDSALNFDQRAISVLHGDLGEIKLALDNA